MSPSRVPHILIVDDTAMLRKVVRRELEPLGAEIREAGDGVEAIESVHRRRPDLITMDLEMPRMDGYEVCRELGRDRDTFDIPIVVLSSNSDAGSRLDALSSGALEFFVKPFPVGSLYRLAAGLLERLARNRTRRIYSLDNDEETRFRLHQRLKQSGFQHVGFSRVDDLLAQMQEQPCDLLLLDFALPDHGTQAVLDGMARLPAGERIGIVALTDSLDHRELVRAYYTGARDLILKPFAPEELLVRVEHQLYRLSEEAELRDLATIDPLTRVYNRGELTRVAHVEIQRALRDEQMLGVLIFDIDHFKRLNDTFGHPFGDEVLRGVGTRIKELLRPMDIVGRYGGEEFVVLIPRATRAGTAVVAERIRRGLAELRFDRPKDPVQVTVSVGGRTWPTSELSVKLEFSELVRPSDEALYTAKRSGRNRCVVDPD